VLDAPRILRILTNHRVQYVVIGGLAMITHGSSHVTEDLDICYRRTDENIVALAEALSPFHPYLRGVPAGLPFSFDPPTIRAGLNFTLTTDLGAIDVFGELAGVGDYEAALAHSEQYEIYGVAVRVLSLEALIASKKVAGRPKDQSHLLELEELKKLRDAATGEPPAG
jgi:predicted nucleotidyltransferase